MPDYNNIKLSVKAYGELKGPVHAPVIKNGNDELKMEGANAIPKEWSTSENQHVVWVASYACKNKVK